MPKTLQDSVGCYIFYRSAGLGYTPIYVGKTSRSFKKEATDSNKLAFHYGPALRKASKGRYHLLFIALNRQHKKDGSARMLTAVQLEAIDELEFDLIRKALKKNPQLSNIHHTGKTYEFEEDHKRGKNPVRSLYNKLLQK